MLVTRAALPRSASRPLLSIRKSRAGISGSRICFMQTRMFISDLLSTFNKQPALSLRASSSAPPFDRILDAAGDNTLPNEAERADPLDRAYRGSHQGLSIRPRQHTPLPFRVP